MTDVTDPTATAPESSRAPAPPHARTRPLAGRFDTNREAIMALQTPIAGTDHGRR
ncbi:hypothetical protein ACRAWC_04985 [Leifsonia sp. L25]|uniref:hypothetical protein n=1 Tax=Actinomycetes TaxID=1760 RepID=UPI003D69ADE8